MLAWFDWIAPAAVPKPILDRLTVELAVVGRDGEVRKRLAGLAVELSGLSGQAFADYARKDREMLAPIVEKAGIKPPRELRRRAYPRPTS